MGPGASKTLIRHSPEQERIGFADQLVLIGAHGFVVDLPDPIHFSVWACNEAVEGDPRGGNNFSHALLLIAVSTHLCGKKGKFGDTGVPRQPPPGENPWTPFPYQVS